MLYSSTISTAVFLFGSIQAMMNINFYEGTGCADSTLIFSPGFEIAQGKASSYNLFETGKLVGPVNDQHTPIYRSFKF